MLFLIECPIKGDSLKLVVMAIQKLTCFQQSYLHNLKLYVTSFGQICYRVAKQRAYLE